MAKVTTRAPCERTTTVEMAARTVASDVAVHWQSAKFNDSSVCVLSVTCYQPRMWLCSYVRSRVSVCLCVSECACLSCLCSNVGKSWCRNFILGRVALGAQRLIVVKLSRGRSVGRLVCRSVCCDTEGTCSFSWQNGATFQIWLKSDEKWDIALSWTQA